MNTVHASNPFRKSYHQGRPSHQSYEPIYSMDNVPVVDHHDHTLGISTGNQMVVAWVPPHSRLLTNELASSQFTAVVDSSNEAHQEITTTSLKDHVLV